MQTIPNWGGGGKAFKCELIALGNLEPKALQVRLLMSGCT